MENNRVISAPSASTAEDLRGYIAAARPILLLLNQNHPVSSQLVVHAWTDFFARADWVLSRATNNAAWAPVHEAGLEVEPAATKARGLMAAGVWGVLKTLVGAEKMQKLADVMQRWGAWWDLEKN